ncbi:MFS transporter [Enemella evansiae]|uniref:MFS transporter n=1 Tax=Enemella evansiae TaxID=2016499 RepID=UPI000B95D53F|nr:MFS transporter [Enemella evansiae]OYO03845.1 MFS transporter [Enemella evansiae]
MSASTLDQTASTRTDSARHGRGFWFVTFAFLVGMAFSTVPTPLYPLYMQADGFSTFMVTVVFAVYAVGVVISLLLAGHVSDWVGRKRILVPALGLELIAALIFLTSTALPALIVARIITGLGVGMLTATATAHLHELHSAHRPHASPQRFQIVSTAANIGGLGAGTLVAGILAQWLPVPLRTPYLVFAALLLVSIVGIALTPETVSVQLQRRYRPQRVSIDHGDRAGYLAAAAAAIAAFSVFGLFTSVAPGFVAGDLHRPSRALAGVIVFAVFGAAAIAQTGTGRLRETARRPLGLLLQLVGLAALVTGMLLASLAFFLIGGVLSGAGAGVLFKDAVGKVIAMSTPERRGEALAGLFLIGYLGLIVPALGIGLAAVEFPASTVMIGFSVLLVVLLAAIALSDARRRTAAA